MNKQALFVGGIGIGAGLMYVLDPDRGGRRRALISDQVTHLANILPEAVCATGRDIANRTYGVVAKTTSAFQPDTVSNDVVVQRIRSKIGRVASHPRAIEVKVDHGRATLSGPILAHEVDELLETVKGVKGASEVVNQLEVHKQAGDIPALQGGRVRLGDRPQVMQENWSPAMRVTAAATGGLMTTWALIRREPLCLLAGVVGLGLLSRGVTNIELKRLIGAGGGRRAIELQKAININAPVGQVFDFWRNFENFPCFMSNIREVRRANGRSHWVVAGPAGTTFEWDAVITKEIPNELLAWKTEGGSAVQNSGVIRFKPNEDETTEVEVKLSYNPPAGAVGHAVAKLFAADPKTQMDEDLMRMKTLIETGHTPHDAATMCMAH